MIAELLNIRREYTIPGNPLPVKVLDDISLKIPPDASIAITGPSGSGKSTLLNILGTLDQPDSGRVTLLGKSIAEMDEPSLSSLRNNSIGFVFQLHHLLPQLTLTENIMLPMMPVKDKTLLASNRERALYLIDRAGLSGRQQHRPSQLSVGECQRTAVVRALINRPKLLIADEPTGSLDTDNALKLSQLLIELQREEHFSLVVATHSETLASMMKMVYRLSFGKLKELSIDSYNQRPSSF